MHYGLILLRQKIILPTNKNNLIRFILNIIYEFMITSSPKTYHTISSKAESRSFQSTQPIADLQSHLLNLWTSSSVDETYQNLFLIYIQTFTNPKQQIRQIQAEIKKTYERNSLYFLLQENVNLRTQIKQQIQQQLQNQTQKQRSPTKKQTLLKQLCDKLKNLRRINLLIAENILKIFEDFKVTKQSSLGSIGKKYIEFFMKIDVENQFIKESFLNEYILFQKGYDPFFLVHYEQIMKSSNQTTLKKHQPVSQLFEMKISYVYRLMRAQQKMLKYMLLIDDHTQNQKERNQLINKQRLLRLNKINQAKQKPQSRGSNIFLPSINKNDAKLMTQNTSIASTIKPLLLLKPRRPYQMRTQSDRHTLDDEQGNDLMIRQKYSLRPMHSDQKDFSSRNGQSFQYPRPKKQLRNNSLHVIRTPQTYSDPYRSQKDKNFQTQDEPLSVQRRPHYNNYQNQNQYFQAEIDPIYQRKPLSNNDSQKRWNLKQVLKDRRHYLRPIRTRQMDKNDIIEEGPNELSDQKNYYSMQRSLDEYPMRANLRKSKLAESEIDQKSKIRIDPFKDKQKLRRRNRSIIKQNSNQEQESDEQQQVKSYRNKNKNKNKIKSKSKRRNQQQSQSEEDYGRKSKLNSKKNSSQKNKKQKQKQDKKKSPKKNQKKEQMNDDSQQYSDDENNRKRKKKTKKKSKKQVAEKSQRTQTDHEDQNQSGQAQQNYQKSPKKYKDKKEASSNKSLKYPERSSIRQKQSKYKSMNKAQKQNEDDTIEKLEDEIRDSYKNVSKKDTKYPQSSLQRQNGQSRPSKQLAINNFDQPTKKRQNEANKKENYPSEQQEQFNKPHQKQSIIQPIKDRIVSDHQGGKQSVKNTQTISPTNKQGKYPQINKPQNSQPNTKQNNIDSKNANDPQNLKPGQQFIDSQNDQKIDKNNDNYTPGKNENKIYNPNGNLNGTNTDRKTQNNIDNKNKQPTDSNQQKTNQQQQSRIKIVPGKINFNQLSQYLKQKKIHPAYKQKFTQSLDFIMKSAQKTQTYLNQFHLNEQLGVIALCSPTSLGNIVIYLWAPIQNICDEKQSVFFFKKYLDYIENQTTFKSIMYCGPQIPQLINQGFEFQKDKNHIRKRVNPIKREQFQFQYFFSIQATNICFEQSTAQSLLYSDQITPLSDTNSWCNHFLLLGKKSMLPQIISNVWEVNQSIKSIHVANHILQKQSYDTFEVGEEKIQFENINMTRCMMSQVPKYGFIANQGFMIVMGKLLTLGQTNKKVCKMEFLNEISLYFGNQFKTVGQMFKYLSENKAKTKQEETKFAFKMFSKQLYGKYTLNDEKLQKGKAYYCNWDINFAWRDQIPGKLIHDLAEIQNKYGGSNFTLLIQMKDQFVLGALIQKQDFLY